MEILMRKNKEIKKIEYIGGDTRWGIVSLQFSRDLTLKEWEALQYFIKNDLREIRND